MLKPQSGIGAMIFAGSFLQSVGGMEVISRGRSADNFAEDCVLQLAGKWLFYRLSLGGGWVWLSAALMDKGDEPEFLLNAADGEAGWPTNAPTPFSI